MNDEYLGDGVYISFDGYHLWLAVNERDNKVVAIDPDVYERLVRYVERLRAARIPKQ